MKTNSSQVRQQRELILKLLDAVNSEEEYRSLEAQVSRLNSWSSTVRRCTTNG